MAIDYTLPSPLNAVAQGLNIGSALNQGQVEKVAAEAAAARTKALSNDINTVFSKESPQAADFAQLTIKYPEMNEQFKQSWEMLDTNAKQGRLQQASTVYAALEAGRPEIAIGELRTQAQAAENSGDQTSAHAAATMADLIEQNPNVAKTAVGLRLATMMGPDKFTETFTKLQTERREAELQPSQLTEAQAKAQKAAVDAKFAESNAVRDLQKKGWDIAKIQNDIGISKENSRIAAMNAQLGRETNDLKRQELQQKVIDAQQKRDMAVQEKTSTVESGRSTIDNFLNTADQVLQTPVGVVDSATGTISSVLPTVSQDVADFEETIKTLSSQAFLSQVPSMKGLGALTEAEGKKLEASLANLSLRQSPEKLLGNVREAQRLMLKARKTLSNRYGVPDVIPDTPAAAPSASEIDALLQKYGGQ